jgi:hypothetical protein
MKQKELGCGLMVGHQPGKHKTLSSNPGTENKKDAAD